MRSQLQWHPFNTLHAILTPSKTPMHAHTHTHWIHLHFLFPPESSNSDYLLAFNFVTTSDNPLILPSKLPCLQIGSLSAEPLSLITSMVSFPAVTVLMHKARFTWCILIWIPLLMASEDAMPQFVHYRLWKKCFIKYLLQMWFFFFFQICHTSSPFPLLCCSLAKLSWCWWLWRQQAVPITLSMSGWGMS